MNKASSSNYYQSKDDEVEFMSKKIKKPKQLVWTF